MLKSNRPSLVAGLVILLCTLGASHPAAADNDDVANPLIATDDGDAFRMYVAGQETYDSNLFRIPSDVAEVTALIGPNQSRDDRLSVISLGAEGQWIFGRQTIILKLRADETRFERHRDLDNTSGNGKFQWNWQLGSKLSGQAGYEYNRSLAAFANTRFFALDLVETNQTFANASYQIGPRWVLFGSATEAHTSNSAGEQRLNDFVSKSGAIRIGYATSFNNTIGAEYDRTDGRFPSDLLVNSTLFNRNYTENSARFLTTYNFTDKTILDASAGYLKRDYNTSTGTFSGDVWRLTLRWLTTEKLQFVFATWHELQAYLDSQSNYFVSKGGSITPVWTVSEKLSFSGIFSYANQNYIGSSLNVLTLGSREDKVTSEQVVLNYTPTRALLFKVTYQYEKRNSNQALFAYNDNLLSANIRFAFY